MASNAVEQVAAQVPADDFQALEEKIYRTIEMYKAARQAQVVAERDAQRLRQQMEDREAELVTLRRETVQLKKEREEIRGRVEKMLQQIESLLARKDKASCVSTEKRSMATATKDQMVKDAQNSSVRVEIFDQAYNLRGSDAEYILKLAEYVDSKMRAVAEATNTIDTVRLAVLAALNIADEYHLLKKKQDGGATEYQKRAHLLADALDQVLGDDRKAG